MIRILHVEDNPDDAELMHLNMSRLSREIDFKWVESGQKAVEILSVTDSFDCVISDFQMPVMNGLDLLRAVRQENNYLPFIFLTGQGNEEIAALALREGADDYFTKDIGFASYQRLLNSILRNVVAYNERREKEQAERALRESEARFRLLAENSTDMISRHAPDGIFLYASPACRQILGFEPEELVGRNIYDLLFPEYADIVRASHDKILKLPEVSTSTYRMRRKDGAPVWLETTSKTIRDEQTGEVLEIHAASRDITARKLAEDLLLESEHRLKTVLHGMPLILFCIDHDGVFTLSEGAGLNGLGLKPGEAVGQSVYSLYKDFPQILRAFEKARDGRTVSESLDMGTIAFDITYVPLRESDGNQQGVIGVASDITARYYAELELMNNRAILQRITDTAPALIYILSLDNNTVTFANRQVSSILGYTEDEIYAMGGDVLRNLIHPEDYHRIQELNRFMRVSGAGAGIEYEYRLRCKDGTWRWMHDHSVVFQRDASGEVSQLLGIATDVTETKDLMSLLRDQTAAFRTTFDTAPVAIVITAIGPPARFVEVNPYFTSVFGMKIDELAAKEPLSLMLSGDKTQHLNEKWEHDGSLTDEVGHFATKDGGVIECRFSAQPLEFKGAPHVLTVLVPVRR